jgi:AraC-like DNA-binding protein
MSILDFLPMKRPLASKTDTAPDFFSRQVSEARRFYLNLNPPRHRSVAVVCGGLERTRPDYQIERETFPFFSIEYVVRGRGVVTLHRRAQALQPGRVFSYGPGIRHQIASDPAEPLVKYFLDFTGRKAKALLVSCGLVPGRVSQVFPPTELQGLFDELIHCGLKATRRSAALCDSLLSCLALKLRDSRAPVDGAEKLAFSTYQTCRQHIQQHFQRLKTLEQLSAECHVNNAYLCRLFRRYDHQSPYQFLLRLKMNQAAWHLQQSGTLVKQAAEAAGFEDAFHFSRVFKRVLGLSPGQFRRLR